MYGVCTILKSTAHPRDQLKSQSESLWQSHASTSTGSTYFPIDNFNDQRLLKAYRMDGNCLQQHRYLHAFNFTQLWPAKLKGGKGLRIVKRVLGKGRSIIFIPWARILADDPPSEATRGSSVLKPSYYRDRVGLRQTLKYTEKSATMKPDHFSHLKSLPALLRIYSTCPTQTVTDHPTWPPVWPGAQALRVRIFLPQNLEGQPQ